ncbi:MAG: hypothetical protein E7434_07180 [Ruminococcaceae bacterium]|nr:hypothetical protein [Oscillospiraceae bacterium]
MAKTKKQTKKQNRETWIAFAIFMLIVAAIACVIIIGRSDSDSIPQRKVMSTEYMEQAPPCPYEIEGYETVSGSPLGALNDSLSLTCVGRYEATGVLAIVVENVGSGMVEHAEVKINCDGLDAFFEVTSLPAGSSAFVVESAELCYVDGMEFKTPIVLGFEEADASLRTDFAEAFEISGEQGVLTITNRTDRKIDAPIEIYYKTKLENDLYFGSTYRSTVETSLAAGESQSVAAENFGAHAQIVCVRYED